MAGIPIIPSNIVSGIPDSLINPVQKSGSGGANFADILQGAMGNVVSTDYEDKLSALGTVAGSDMDIHTSQLASSKAELSLNLTLQMRNKVLEAYQEIMRMQM